MATMTMREKLEFLNSTNDPNTIGERIESGQVFQTKRGQTSVKVDLRARIRRALEENGISQRELAERLGKQRNCITSFLSGTIPIPLADIEEILWLIEDGNMKRGE